MRLINELYSYRELLKSNIKKEIRGKYKGSILGVLWSFVSPLLMVLVYALIFPKIMKGSPNSYYVYLTTGILPWIFFTSALASGTTTVLANTNLIKKVSFPRVILPISVVVSGAVNFVISVLVILVFLVISKIGFSYYILLFPLVLLIQFILTLGFVFFLSAINVYIRDVEYIVNFLILLLMYLTPILWEVSLIKDVWNGLGAKLVYLNPMAGVIQSYHKIFYYKELPDMKVLLFTGLFSIIFCILGYFTFRKLEKGFAEEI